jgi:hypothetical protein
MGILAAAGAIGGCSGSSVHEVEKPTLEKGNRKRLDTISEKAEQAAQKKKR